MTTDKASPETKTPELESTPENTAPETAGTRQAEVRQTALAVRDTGKSLLSTMSLGLKVLASEYKWLGLKGMRAFEIRQLGKRLDQEYTVLGRALSNLIDDPEAEQATIDIDEDTRLALRQISFLRDEIELLKKEQEQLREHFVARRNAAWNKDS